MGIGDGKYGSVTDISDQRRRASDIDHLEHHTTTTLQPISPHSDSSHINPRILAISKAAKQIQIEKVMMILTENKANDKEGGIVDSSSRRSSSRTVEQHGQIDVFEPSVGEPSLIVPQRKGGKRTGQQGPQEHIISFTTLNSHCLTPIWTTTEMHDAANWTMNVVRGEMRMAHNEFLRRTMLATGLPGRMAPGMNKTDCLARDRKDEAGGEHVHCRKEDGQKEIDPEEEDIHAKLMKAYPEVPHWWYWGLVVGFFIIACVSVQVRAIVIEKGAVANGFWFRPGRLILLFIYSFWP
ncbi:4193_t:CDS:2, partial [Acaulospora colombiana]